MILALLAHTRRNGEIMLPLGIHHGEPSILCRLAGRAGGGEGGLCNVSVLSAGLGFRVRDVPGGASALP